MTTQQAAGEFPMLTSTQPPPTYPHHDTIDLPQIIIIHVAFDVEGSKEDTDEKTGQHEVDQIPRVCPQPEDGHGQTARVLTVLCLHRPLLTHETHAHAQQLNTSCDVI